MQEERYFQVVWQMVDGGADGSLRFVVIHRLVWRQLLGRDLFGRDNDSTVLSVGSDVQGSRGVSLFPTMMIVAEIG